MRHIYGSSFAGKLPASKDDVIMANDRDYNQHTSLTIPPFDPGAGAKRAVSMEKLP